MLRAASSVGRQHHLGRNNEVYNAELYAHIRQSLQIFDERGERVRRYTLFADFASAIDQVASDRLGPGQCLAVCGSH